MISLNLNPSSASPAGFPFLEQRVRAALGWNADEMRQARKNRLLPTHFRLFKKRIYLSGEAVALLSNGLGEPPPKKTAAARPAANADDPQPLPRAMRVVKAAVTNPRIILACPQEEDPLRPKTLLRVRIKPG